jgi:O-antigen/teichoic acid export membrane protein
MLHVIKRERRRWSALFDSMSNPSASFRRDMILTFATEFALLFSMLVVLWLAARYWDLQSFGRYVTIRRVLGLVQLAILCGMGLAIPRYVALARAGGESRTPGAFLVAGVGIALLGSGIISFVCTAFSQTFAQLTFGAADENGLIVSQGVAATGLACHAIVYAWFRGRMEMLACNLFQLGNLGLLPLAVFLVPGQTVSDHITLLGLGWGGVSGTVLLCLMISQPSEVWRLSEWFPAAIMLLRYGLLRLPGDLAYGMLWTMPVTLAGRLHGAETAGFVGLGVTVMLVIGSLVAPVGQIVLPRAITLSARGDLRQLRREAFHLVIGAIVVSTVLVVGFQVFGPFLLQLYLGEKFSAGISCIRILVVASVPFCAYVALRNVLDALRVAPLNTKNLILAVVTFLLLTVFGGTPTFIAGASAVSVLLLGVLTGWDGVRLLYSGLKVESLRSPKETYQ